jgi:opacity protein-like surface antigen
MKSLLIALLILFSFSSQAQILSGYGVKLGVGVSNQSWTNPPYFDDMGYKNKTGLSARLFADVLDFTFFEFEGELGFTRKGFTDDIPVTTAVNPYGTGEIFSISNSLDYLSISVLAKIKYNVGAVTPYLIAGPQMNFLVHKNVEKGWKVFFDKFEKSNLGFSAGAGIELLKILPVSILAEYRFEKDFNFFSK